jgi:hypothetical protein
MEGDNGLARRTVLPAPVADPPTAPAVQPPGGQPPKLVARRQAAVRPVCLLLDGSGLRLLDCVLNTIQVGRAKGTSPRLFCGRLGCQVTPWRRH